MKKIVFILVMLLFMWPMSVMAQRGCCSSHGGVVGCSPDGRQVCADGTLSPSCECTPPTIYGCTDSKADNYNANANKDDGSCVYTIYGCMTQEAINYNSSANTPDGSCIFQKEVIEQISIPFEVEYTFNKDNVREGKEGLQEITYQIQYDEQNNEINRKILSEKITIEPVSQIILQESQLSNEEESNGENYVVFLFYVAIFIFNLIFIKRKIDRNCILKKVLAARKKYLYLFLYFILVIPTLIDFVLLIIPKKS